MKTKSKSNSGYTIVEVVAVIGITCFFAAICGFAYALYRLVFNGQ